MTESKEKLFNLERQLFELEMKDHWDNADFDLSRELREEIKNVDKREKVRLFTKKEKGKPERWKRG